MTTPYAARSGYALHDDMMTSSRGIGLFTSMIATLAVVIAISFALASRVAPTPGPGTVPGAVEPAAGGR